MTRRPHARASWQAPARPPASQNRRVGALGCPCQSPYKCSRNFSIAPSHNRRGIALASLGKLDDAHGDDPVGEIVCKPKGYARHFECDTQNPLGFGIDI
jgi:hypothetical protein